MEVQRSCTIVTYSKIRTCVFPSGLGRDVWVDEYRRRRVIGVVWHCNRCWPTRTLHHGWWTHRSTLVVGHDCIRIIYLCPHHSSPPVSVVSVYVAWMMGDRFSSHVSGWLMMVDGWWLMITPQKDTIHHYFSTNPSILQGLLVVGKMNWEPLPPRKPRKRALSSADRSQASASSDAQTDVSPPDVPSSNHQPQAIRAAAIIEANIAARAMVNRLSQTTLESQDGCAGEFYECKSFFATLELYF